MENRRRVKCTSVSSIKDINNNKEDLLNEQNLQNFQNLNSPKENKFPYKKNSKEKPNKSRSPINSQNNPYGNLSSNYKVFNSNIIPLKNYKTKVHNNNLNNTDCQFNKNNLNFKTEIKQIKFIRVDKDKEKNNNNNNIHVGADYNLKNKEFKSPNSNPYCKKYSEEIKSKDINSVSNENNDIDKRKMSEELLNNFNNINLITPSNNNIRKYNSKKEDNHPFYLSDSNNDNPNDNNKYDNDNNNKNEFNLICISDNEKEEKEENAYEINKENIISEVKKEMQNDFHKCLEKNSIIPLTQINQITTPEFKLEIKKVKLENIFLDENLIIKATPDYNSFICQICHSIVKDPIVCHSRECDSIFCTNCIDGYLKINQKCPICRRENFIKENINRNLKSFLANMKIICPLGCTEIITYQNLKNHLDVCTHLEKSYKCSLCEMSFSFIKETSKFEMEKHKKNCEKILLECEFCHKEMLRNQYEIHLYQCGLRILKCEKCGFKFPLKFKSAHDGFYCEEISGFVENFGKIFK